MRYPIFPKFIGRIAFALICLVQLFAIGSQIYSYEKILNDGERFLFRVSPADPYDPFRGRYVTFVLREDNVTAEPFLGDEAYASLVKEGDFRAVIKNLTAEPPIDTPYLKVESYRISEDGKASVTLPFSRFYMREDLARRADRLDTETLSRIDASVKVLNGKGIIEELFLDGLPLADYLKQN